MTASDLGVLPLTRDALVKARPDLWTANAVTKSRFLKAIRRGSQIDLELLSEQIAELELFGLNVEGSPTAHLVRFKMPSDGRRRHLQAAFARKPIAETIDRLKGALGEIEIFETVPMHLVV